jgi:hypothetical protein
MTAHKTSDILPIFPNICVSTRSDGASILWARQSPECDPTHERAVAEVFAPLLPANDQAPRRIYKTGATISLTFRLARATDAAEMSRPPSCPTQISRFFLFNLSFENKRVRKIFGSGTMYGNVAQHVWSPSNFPHSEERAKCFTS